MALKHSATRSKIKTWIILVIVFTATILGMNWFSPSLGKIMVVLQSSTYSKSHILSLPLRAMRNFGRGPSNQNVFISTTSATGKTVGLTPPIRGGGITEPPHINWGWHSLALCWKTYICSFGTTWMIFTLTSASSHPICTICTTKVPALSLPCQITSSLIRCTTRWWGNSMYRPSWGWIDECGTIHKYPRTMSRCTFTSWKSTTCSRDTGSSWWGRLTITGLRVLFCWCREKTTVGVSGNSSFVGTTWKIWQHFVVTTIANDFWQQILLSRVFQGEGTY